MDVRSSDSYPDLDPAPSADQERQERSYEVFLSLYQNHREFFDELAELDHPWQNSLLSGGSLRYVQGIVRGQQAYLITNLSSGKTQSLLQHQMIWTIGRDIQAALPVQDQRLSRRHAAIQYVGRRGFYLVDLNSTNGSFINGRVIRGRYRLRDGDRVRLGGFSFDFFVCHSSQIANSVAPELLDKLNAMPLPDDTESNFSTSRDALGVRRQGDNNYGADKTRALQPELNPDDVSAPHGLSESPASPPLSS